jgi:acyl dehydratase
MRYFEDMDIGWTQTVGTHELTAAEIVEFATEWDPQPWHVDAGAARRSPMGGLTASSVHTYAIAARLLNRMEPAAGIASLRHELELPNPARPGDRLTLTLKLIDKRPSGSKTDRGLVTFEGTLANQAGLPVLTLRSLMMVRTHPADAAAPEAGATGGASTP